MVDSSGQSQRPSHLQYRWVVFALILCLVPLCFLGYGSDNDIYGVVESGFSTWHLHVLETSRNPGYWTYEAVVYMLSAIGGYVLSNLMSLAVMCVLAWRFYRLAIKLKIPSPFLLLSCMIVTPAFLIASTSSIDYVWSLLCIVLAAEMLLADRFMPACLFAALAISFRAANIVVIAGGFAALIGYGIYREKRIAPISIKLVLTGIASAVLGCSTYILSYRVHGNSMDFLAPMIGPASMWSMKMRVGRFVYKGCYLFGPAAMVVIAVALFLYIRRGSLRAVSSYDAVPRRHLVLFCGFLLGNLALFFKYPIEYGYLIPAVFFFLLIAGATLFRDSRNLVFALLICIVSFNFVQVGFAQPNIPGKATSAHLHLSIAPGVLLQDIQERRLVIRCKTADCWNQQHR